MDYNERLWHYQEERDKLLQTAIEADLFISEFAVMLNELAKKWEV